MKKQLAEVEQQLQPLLAKYKQEKAVLDQLQALHKKREQLLIQIEAAQNRYDLALVADLKYGALTEVEEAIRGKQAEARNNSMLSDVVGPDAIAAVVARWTGIPVQRLQQSDKQKLLGLREQLHTRVVGQDDAVRGWCMGGGVWWVFLCMLAFLFGTWVCMCTAPCLLHSTLPVA